MMVFKLLRKDPSAATIEALYGAIVAQARLPAFYERYGVPDTVEGRFEMLVLHLALVLDRLGEPLAAGLMDAFCRDLDHNLREMGVSDLAVPRRMRGYMEAFYGRARAYGAALTAGDRAACAAALARNVQGRAEPDDGARALADYMMSAARALAETAPTALNEGRAPFPAP